MNTSSRFMVAVHIMTGLAAKHEVACTFGADPKCNSDQLAESVNTNPVVIRRLLRELQQAGFVESKQGRGGGSYLAQPAEAITLAAIYDAVEEGDLFHLHYSEPNPVCPIGSNIQEAVDDVFKRAEKAMRDELDKTTIADIVEHVMELTGMRERIAQAESYEALYDEMMAHATAGVF